MKINIALWDRMLRFFFGVILLSWAIAGGPWWSYFGLYLILTSSWGLCPVYSMLNFRTAKADERPLAPPEL